MNDFFDDDDDFIDVPQQRQTQQRNRQALMNRVRQANQLNIDERAIRRAGRVLPEMFLEQEDLIPSSLIDPERKQRIERFDFVRADGAGGYVRARVNVVNENSACHCILSSNNPPAYVCTQCRREICGSQDCSFSCARCWARVCRGCLIIHKGVPYCSKRCKPWW